jgi:hypothetical protein
VSDLGGAALGCLGMSLELAHRLVGGLNEALESLSRLSHAVFGNARISGGTLNGSNGSLAMAHSSHLPRRTASRRSPCAQSP